MFILRAKLWSEWVTSIRKNTKFKAIEKEITYKKINWVIIKKRGNNDKK